MRCWSSLGCCTRIWFDHCGNCCKRPSKALRVAPSASKTSTRSSTPKRCNASCMAPTSMTAVGPPAALMVPAMRRVCSWPFCCHCSGALRACVSLSCRACSVAALTNTASGANKSSRSPPSNKRGISAGATLASFSASLPSKRSAVLGARASLLVVGAVSPGGVSSSTEVSSQGTAWATSACWARRAYQSSGKPPCML